MSEKEINILIIDDHPFVRKGIRTALESEKGFNVCGEASNTNEAKNILDKEAIDIAIIDISIDDNFLAYRLQNLINVPLFILFSSLTLF